MNKSFAKCLLLATLFSSTSIISCYKSVSTQDNPAGGNAKSTEETSSVLDGYDALPLAQNEVRMVANKEVLFEAEKAIPTKWKNSGWGGDSTFVAYDTEANASGGAFVTPATGSNDEDRPYRQFQIILTAPSNGTVTMKVAYCRGGKNTKEEPIDYSYVYQYRLDKNRDALTCKTEDPIETEISNWNWREIEFSFNITAGQHYLEGFIDENTTSTNAGCPCIDYYKFTLGVK